MRCPARGFDFGIGGGVVVIFNSLSVWWKGTAIVGILSSRLFVACAKHVAVMPPRFPQEALR